MTTREEENLPSDEDRENLEDNLSDDCVIVILEEGDIPAQVSEETTAAQEVAPENTPQLINLTVGASTPLRHESTEDFSDLIAEVEEKKARLQQHPEQPQPQPQPQPQSQSQPRLRRQAPAGPENWSLGELEEELDEEIQNELFPWAGRLGLPWLGGAIVLLAIALLGVLLLIGRGYYELPIARRAFHHLHDTLRPSGTVGLTLGITGLGVILFSLLYLVRKRLVSWARFGSLQGWLGVHIFTGFLGPAMILFHAAFVPYSAIGFLAFASMLVIVVSGIVGRYVYVYCPKTLEGRELELEDVRQRLAVYRKKLTQLGIDASLLRIDEPATNKGRRMPWLIEAVIGVIWGDRQSKQEFSRLSAAIAERDDLHDQMSRILALARRLSKERQWVVRYNELRKIMGAWRFFHRWLAIIMLLAILYHVGITVTFGDLWIFGGNS